MTQSTAYHIIRQIKIEKDPYQDALDQTPTKRNTEQPLAAAEEANEDTPSERELWRSTWHKYFSRNIWFFMWMLLHNGYKVGKHWEHITGHEQNEICNHCGVRVDATHPYPMRCAQPGNSMGPGQRAVEDEDR
jgi:ribonuclease HI